MALLKRFFDCFCDANRSYGVAPPLRRLSERICKMDNTYEIAGLKLVGRTAVIEIENYNAEKNNCGKLTFKAFALERANYTEFGNIACFTGKEIEKFSGQADYNAADGVFAINLEGAEDGTCYRVEMYENGEKVTAFIIDSGKLYLSSETAGYIAGQLTEEELASLTVGTTVGTTGDKAVWGDSGETVPIKRFNVPALSVNDGPQGIRLAQNTVWYPSDSLLASTWDTDIIENIGRQIGEDACDLGVDVVLGCGMNLQRVTLCGRNFEYFSEDPLLTGLAAAAYTKGVQSTGAGVSLKHYAVNNQETARSLVSSEVTERAMRELYLKGFQLAVADADPMTVMSSYNKFNGTYTSVSKPLLSVLREDFGFNGLIMSDWDSGGDSSDKIAAGNDLTMPGHEDEYEEVLQSLRSGKLTRAEAEQAAENILKVICRSNGYKDIYNGKRRAAGKIDKEAQRKEALEAAEAGMVLLKNDNNALPLEKNAAVELMGDACKNTIYGGDGSGVVYCEKQISVYEGIISKGFREADSETSADCGIIVIGRTSTEGEDHANKGGDFRLSDEELALINNAAERYRSAGKKLAVILNTGNPIEVKSWLDRADAVLWSGYAGEMTGAAVAEILSGDKNPEGRLAITWPESIELTGWNADFPGSAASTKYGDDIYVGYRFYETFGVEASFAFGHGLSYTTFRFGNFRATADNDGAVTLSVTVKNTGKTSGREVAEFYVSKPENSGFKQPALELCGFRKTRLLAPGETETVEVTVKNEYIFTYNEATREYTVPAGNYTFSVGRSASDIVLSESAELAGGVLFKAYESLPAPAKKFELLNPEKGFDRAAALRKSAAIGCDTYCSADEGGKYPSANAVDGEKNTRWSGVGSADKRWLVVDLGKPVSLSEIEIVWESNNAYQFTVYYSADNEVTGGTPGTSELPENISWTELRTVEFELADTDFVGFDGISARFIKIEVPSKAGWCSIYQLKVFEQATGAADN